MPRPPRRRRIAKTNVKSSAIKTIPAAEEAKRGDVSASRIAVPLLTSSSVGLPSSPPLRRRSTRSSTRLSSRDVTLSDMTGEVDDSAFLPPVTSTPKQEVGHTDVPRPLDRIRSSTAPRLRNSSLSKAVLTRRSHLPSSTPEPVTAHQSDDADEDNKSTSSSQGSDPFGFDNIRGIKVSRPLSSTPSPPSSPVSSRVVSGNSRVIESSDVDEYEQDASPVKIAPNAPESLPMTSPLASDMSEPASSVAMEQIAEVARRDKLSKRLSKGTAKWPHELTTAQLTELLPQRGLARHRRERSRTRTRTRTRSNEDSDDLAISSSDEEKDEEPAVTRRRKKTRTVTLNAKKSRSGKANKADKENKVSTRGAKGTKAKEEGLQGALRGRLEDQGADGASSDREEDDDSADGRARENDRLRQKFEDVDDWALVTETVAADSGSLSSSSMPYR
ncbi:uncharacterized protein V1518DRAFT_424100 [Limtongia smithiae]|uniref:uncharacterized protein n=1 Tax=Limtongia smithiae TaxID=1125753 RepID=UPI0034CD7B58